MTFGRAMPRCREKRRPLELAGAEKLDLPAWNYNLPSPRRNPASDSSIRTEWHEENTWKRAAAEQGCCAHLRQRARHQMESGARNRYAGARGRDNWERPRTARGRPAGVWPECGKRRECALPWHHVSPQSSAKMERIWISKMLTDACLPGCASISIIRRENSFAASHAMWPGRSRAAARIISENVLPTPPKLQMQTARNAPKRNCFSL